MKIVLPKKLKIVYNSFITDVNSNLFHISLRPLHF
jgi:hypothetical protein